MTNLTNDQSPLTDQGWVLKAETAVAAESARVAPVWSVARLVKALRSKLAALAFVGERAGSGTTGS